ncbi:MAG: hypothetical protein IJX62_03855 [Clostridia bacterium]|nr:hypothetical protein [Clostridia bacterium]
MPKANKSVPFFAIFKKDTKTCCVTQPPTAGGNVPHRRAVPAPKSRFLYFEDFQLHTPMAGSARTR